ncbi:uncharacterized protein METZ01_LOCUS38293, partial [marine metagenome]
THGCGEYKHRTQCQNLFHVSLPYVHRFTKVSIGLSNCGLSADSTLPNPVYPPNTLSKTFTEEPQEESLLSI